MGLVREVPCSHAERKDFGRGIIVGSELVPAVNNKTQQIEHQSLMLVTWENVHSPCPSFHSPEELICAIDFDEEYETEDDNDFADANESDNNDLIDEDDEDIEEAYEVDPEQGPIATP